MTATTTRTKAKPARVPCPNEGCTYSAEPGSSIAGHVAMCPFRSAVAVGLDGSARNDTYAGVPLDELQEPMPHTPAAPVGSPHAGAATLTEALAEALAVGAVLFRAHDAARHLEHLLELEAPDPRVAELMRDAKRIRKSIAALLVDVAIEGARKAVVPTA